MSPTSHDSPVNTDQDLTGRTVVVTGASSGIGLHTAIGLAATGAHVYAHARTITGASAAAERIRADSGGPVTPVFADLSTMAGVRQLAEQVNAASVDVLINNAGAAFATFATTADGFERTLATNHLSGALLVDLLLPRLRASGQARVIQLSSSLAHKANFDPSEPWTERGYNELKTYASSKLWTTLYAQAIARRYAADHIAAYAVDPGSVATGFGKKAGGPLRLMMVLAKPFIASPAKGARSSIWTASVQPPPPSGSFITRGKPMPSFTDASSGDRRRIEQAWTATRTLLGLPSEA